MRTVKSLGPDGNKAKRPDEDLPPQTPPIHAPHMFMLVLFTARFWPYTPPAHFGDFPPAAHGTALPLSLIAIPRQFVQRCLSQITPTRQGLWLLKIPGVQAGRLSFAWATRRGHGLHTSRKQRCFVFLQVAHISYSVPKVETQIHCPI